MKFYSGIKNQNAVVLTFDDGPNPIIKETNAKRLQGLINQQMNYREFKLA